MIWRIFVLGVASVFVVVRLFAQPIKLHRDNPRCYLFSGRPTVLITSAEDGALINGLSPKLGLNPQ
jgi:hypothetical protein